MNVPIIHSEQSNLVNANNDSKIINYDQVAFIFPGQGSQAIGMGYDLITQHPKMMKFFHIANNILGFDLTQYIWNDCNEFKQNNIVQAAIYVVSCIMSELETTVPNIVAGHSLGEYAAMYTAGLITFEEGLQIIKVRGEYMNDVCQKIDSGMIACLGTGDIDGLAKVSQCEIANYNTPEQIVLSGLLDNIDLVLKLGSEYGFKRCIKLNTAGAYHSSLMQPAADKFALFLEKFNLNNRVSTIPVISNITAKPIINLKQNMIKQITSQVRWSDIVQSMIDQGVKNFIEVGNSNVLTKMLRHYDY